MQIEKGFTDNWLQPTGAQERLMRQYAGCKRLVSESCFVYGASPLPPRREQTNRQVCHDEATHDVAQQSRPPQQLSQRCTGARFAVRLVRTVRLVSAILQGRAGSPAAVQKEVERQN